jgi:hypothetical protein
MSRTIRTNPALRPEWGAQWRADLLDYPPAELERVIRQSREMRRDARLMATERRRYSAELRRVRRARDAE